MELVCDLVFLEKEKGMKINPCLFYKINYFGLYHFPGFFELLVFPV